MNRANGRGMEFGKKGCKRGRKNVHGKIKEKEVRNEAQISFLDQLSLFRCFYC